VILSAPSGAGKTSLSRALVERLSGMGQACAISVSYTTRGQRPGERDGDHYHFIDGASFEQMVAEERFLEHATVFGRRYGTGREHTRRLVDAGTVVLLDIDWQGRRQVAAAWPEALSIFILPPSAYELERRLRARGQDSEAEIAARMRDARSEMVHFDEYDYLIINEQFERALDELVSIVAANRLRTSAQSQRRADLLAQLLAGEA